MDNFTSMKRFCPLTNRFCRQDCALSMDYISDYSRKEYKYCAISSIAENTSGIGISSNATHKKEVR